MVAYATRTQLVAWVDDDVTVPNEPDAGRMLERASTLIDRHVTVAFDIDTATDLPSDADVAAALRDATCAQVEFWLVAVGEDHDIAGIQGDVSVGPMGWTLPGRLAPRAADILTTEGLTAGVYV